jgi:hypothetical protein
MLFVVSVVAFCRHDATAGMPQRREVILMPMQIATRNVDADGYLDIRRRCRNGLGERIQYPTDVAWNAAWVKILEQQMLKTLQTYRVAHTKTNLRHWNLPRLARLQNT